MAKKKETTLDDLARMVQRGFLEMGKRMDDGFKALVIRMDSMEEVVERVGRVEQLVDEDHTKRISRLEKHVETLYERLSAATAKEIPGRGRGFPLDKICFRLRSVI